MLIADYVIFLHKQILSVPKATRTPYRITETVHFHVYLAYAHISEMIVYESET